MHVQQIMQFVTNGPDIPDELLQAHEEGRVIFFCGAGISYPAGLPGFRGLVDALWPKSRNLASNGIAESRVQLSIAARSEFPSALSSVIDWLRPVEHPHYVVHKLHESGLAGRFPQDALSLLNAVINNQTWAPTELSQCLMAISQSAPALNTDHRFQRLLTYARQHGV